MMQGARHGMLILVLLVAGCQQGGALGTAAAEPDEGALVKQELASLAGTWRVEEWRTTKGPFARNVGWTFKFEEAEMKMDKQDGGEPQLWSVELDPSSEPKRMVIESRPDFDGDGKPDFVLNRHCLYRLEDEGKTLKLLYGSSNVQAEIDLKSGPPKIKEIKNDPGMPQELAPSKQGDLLTLTRLDAE